MEPEKDKQSSHKTPYTELEQVNSDFILAISMQEQERNFTMLATIDSEESNIDEDDESESSFDDDGSESNADFFESQEFGSEDLQFLEGDDEEMEEEDEIDPDDLSYEELIELGEFIGEEKRGLSVNEIQSCLNPQTCDFGGENKTGIIDRCVICQVEYEQDEQLAALQCDHPYHTDCITKWLQIKKVCPICGTEVSTPKLPKN